MTLEKELVFQLRKEGSSEADVLEIIAMMGNPDILKTKPVKLNHTLVKVALSQYNAVEELKKRDIYVKKDKEKLKELIEQNKKEIIDTEPRLLSVKIKRKIFTLTYQKNDCNNCSGYRSANLYFARITYLNGKGGIPTPIKKKKDLFVHCSKCGYLEEF